VEEVECMVGVIKEIQLEKPQNLRGRRQDTPIVAAY
jgi:hypothetical protein